jgi:putative superfamily III holin-X
METQFESTPDTHVASLLTGIADDAKRLLIEQLTLFQVEIKHDVRRLIEAIVPIMIGALVLVPAVILLGMGAAYGVCWLFPDFPTWAGFAIVGCGLAVGGGALVAWGAWSLKSVNPLPNKSLQGLKENLQWKTKT